MKNDNEMLYIVIVIGIIIIIKAGLTSYFDYKKTQIELSQPKYSIEFNQDAYELKKIN